jgi:hypothetical protein
LSDVLAGLIGVGAYPAAGGAYKHSGAEGDPTSVLLSSLLEAGLVSHKECDSSSESGFALTDDSVRRLQHSWWLEDPTPALKPRDAVLP